MHEDHLAHAVREPSASEGNAADALAKGDAEAAPEPAALALPAAVAV